MDAHHINNQLVKLPSELMVKLCLLCAMQAAENALTKALANAYHVWMDSHCRPTTLANPANTPA